MNFIRLKSFTLAEVLITLGIIGVVASITIPTLMQNLNDNAFKVAYKKAYSDMSNAFIQAIQENSLTPRAGSSDFTATTSEWAVIKNAFKVIKECTSAQLYDCWANADTVCDGAYGISTGLPTTSVSTNSFIDKSGRSWSEYSTLENIYLVDTNGFKPPNKFGKDRWIFTFLDSNNTRITTGLPAKIGVLTGDKTTAVGGCSWCHNPPCYYHSWLYDN